MENTIRRKLVIIGIDGGTFKIIDPLIKEGKLPNLEKLIKSGVNGILKSTIPPITAAAWVSFMTGKNPGKHGLFDFREYNPTEYTQTYIPMERHAVKEDVATLHSSRFQGETLWDYLSKAGYEMTLVAIPMTYPPWKINGRMVPGFPTPDYNKPKTYPPEWGEEIGQLFNMRAIDYFKIEKCIRECKELVKRKGRIILDQIRNNRGEIFAVIFSSSDFAQHFFWKFLEQQNHMYSSIIEEIYQEIDNFLGEILDLIDNDTSIIIISDHGFMSHPDKYFNLNSWLVREGYISLNQNKGLSRINIFSKVLDTFLNQIIYKKIKWKLAIKEKITKIPVFIQRWVSKQYFKSDLIDWDRTKTFRFKMYTTVKGIVINQKDRQKKGIVNKGEEYERLREEIIKKILQLKDSETGESVVAEAYKQEEIYKGNYLKNAPDIIINLNPNYVGGLGFEGTIISPVQKEVKKQFSGIHSEDGIFIFYGPNVKKALEINPVSIMDIAPTILYDLNLPISEDIDGKIIMEAFSDSYKINLPRYIAIKKESKKTEEILSEGDEESMKKALKSLGYLD